jgi:cell division transport system permease protein
MLESGHAPRRGPLMRALGQMGQNLWLQGVAVSSLAVTLAILFAYLNLGLNLYGSLQRLITGASVLVVLAEDAAPGRGPELALQLAKRKEVLSATFVPKNEALKRFREQLAGKAGLLKGLSGNPLPDAVELQLTSGAAPVMVITNHLRGLPGVAEVVTSRPWLHQLEQAAGIAAEVGSVLGVLLLAGVVLVVANTVRLAVYVRREDLEIMALVGATVGYMRRPFLWETALQCLAATGLALLLVRGLLAFFSAPVSLPLGLDMTELLQFRPMLVPPFVLAALAAGLAGSWLGVGRVLQPKAW